jgi:predicted transposase YbfD/YdcC
VPARTSSPIPSALEQLGSPTDSLTSSDVADLRRFLILITDPRDVRGLRYPAVALLCAAVSAVLAGARSLIAISEWITDAPQYALGVLGFAADPLTGLRPVPHAATVRRLLQHVDGDALDAAIGAFLQARTPPPAEPKAKKGPVRRVIAVDGKVVRGSRTKTATAIQLLAAMDHHGVVLAQRQVASKSNEIPAFAPLLRGLDLQNAVVTADALHTQQPAWPTRETGMGTPHGEAEDPGHLSTLPRRYPRRAAHHDLSEVITGERYAGKLARTFGKGPSEKDPSRGYLVGGLLHLKRRGLETEYQPPRQSPTLPRRSGGRHPGGCQNNWPCRAPGPPTSGNPHGEATALRS